MALSNKAKNYIRKHHTKKSVHDLAKALKVDESEISGLIDEIAPKLSLKKKMLFYAITFSIPVIFFLLVEGVLRSVNYLGNTALFIDPNIPSEEYLMPNPNFASRYFFYTKTIPTPSIDVFLKEKPENSYRIFAMGGSSAAGYPYGFNGTFSRIVDDVLTDAMPQKNVEVVNVATSAISTYILYDQVDEIIEQKPDAILIYAGHNEFYGALGIGSNESIGAYPGFVRFYLKLQRFKTFLFLRDMMVRTGKWIGSLSGKTESTGTLMERIIKDQSIALNSTEFEMAMLQFESNMSAIIESFGEENIPVYIGTLASNLKDQPPFVSIENGENPTADSIYQLAQNLYSQNKFQQAKTQFKFAKDLDGLKFRAPSQINEIIRKFPEKYDHVKVVPVLEQLEREAENGIIGNELMLEHLHPNKHGYFILGKAFSETLIENLKAQDLIQNLELNEERYFNKMYLTNYDQRVVEHRIRTLKQGFPFKTENENPYQYNYDPDGLLDSLAFSTVHKQKRWDEAKVELAWQYESDKNYEKALQEYFGLIRNQPWNDSPYIFAARVYLNMNDFSNAQPLLEKAYQISPKDAYTTKMLGALELNKGNVTRAIKLLEESRLINPEDPQTLYNLSGAFGKNQEIERAIKVANEVIELNPNYPGIQNWKMQLIRITNQRN